MIYFFLGFQRPNNCSQTERTPHFSKLSKPQILIHQNKKSVLKQSIFNFYWLAIPGSSFKSSTLVPPLLRGSFFLLGKWTWIFPRRQDQKSGCLPAPQTTGSSRVTPSAEVREINLRWPLDILYIHIGCKVPWPLTKIWNKTMWK